MVEYQGADLFLYYYKSDHAFSSSMTDLRARIIAPEDAHIQWRANSVNPQEVWPQRGTPPFTLAGVHYWRNKIDFDYVDIGANVGMGVIALAVFFRRCGWNTKVYAFEPGPVYDLLLRSVRINGVGDVVKCVRAAVAEHSGRAQFHVTPHNRRPAAYLVARLSVQGSSQAILLMLIWSLLTSSRVNLGKHQGFWSRSTLKESISKCLTVCCGHWPSGLFVSRLNFIRP